MFNVSKNPTLAKKFAFVFEIVNLSDLLNFQLSLLDHKVKPIKFKEGKQKIPTLTFSIQEIK